MNRARYLATGLLLSVMCLSTTASAQSMTPTVCADRTQALIHLSGKYSEAPVAMGLASNGGIVEVLSSKIGDS